MNTIFSSKPVINFSACLLRRTLQGGFLVVQDLGKQNKIQFKHLGGLENPEIDANFTSWWYSLSETLREVGYSSKEIQLIANWEEMQENYSMRDPHKRCAIRKSLEKTGSYVLELTQLYYLHTAPKLSMNNPVDMHFFLAKSYITPEKIEVLANFKCRDKSVLGCSWISPEELLCENDDQARLIVGSHRMPTQKATQRKDSFARKISISELSEMAIKLK